MIKPTFIAAVLGTMLSLSAVADENVNLSFQNTDIKEVMDLYKQLSGHEIVYDSQLAGAITLKASDLSKDKAVALIEKALFASGVTLIQQSKDVVQVISAGRNPRLEALPLITREEEIPANERVVTYIYKLKYRDADEITALIQNSMVPALGGYTCIVPDRGTKTVMITERSSVLKRIVSLLKEFDVKTTVIASNDTPSRRVRVIPPPAKN